MLPLFYGSFCYPVFYFHGFYDMLCSFLFYIMLFLFHDITSVRPTITVSHFLPFLLPRLLLLPSCFSFIIFLIFFCVSSHHLHYLQISFCSDFLLLPFKCLLILCRSLMFEGWAKVLTENSVYMEEEPVSQ